MTMLQKQAHQMINNLSEDNLNYLVDFIKRFMLPENKEEKTKAETSEMQVFHRLEEMSTKISENIPHDFNVDKELEEARRGRYGNIS